MTHLKEDNLMTWFVMRDLKRPNAKLPAYKMLGNEDFEVFTPMQWKVLVKGSRRVKEAIPIIPDLLFVRSTRERLDPVVRKVDTLQYRYERGAYCKPMTVPETEMCRFIHAVNTTNRPKYFLPEELSSRMLGRTVRIVGGPLDGFEGQLLSVRGTKKKYLVIELPGFLSAGVEVAPEYIELLE